MNIYGLGKGLGMPLSPGFQFSNFLAKLYINIYHSQKNLEQSLEWLVRNSPDKIWLVLGTPVGQA